MDETGRIMSALAQALPQQALESEMSQCGILVVEDDFIGRATLVQILKKNGFTRIAEAENGKEGLALLDRFRPSLIICDIQMPEMDGFEFCRRVRSHGDPALSGLPILVETALTQSDEKARVFVSGASDYVGKPVDAVELAARCRVHLERELMTRRLRDFNRRVSEELETARSTQRILIPSPEMIRKTEADYGLCMREHAQSCSELGGDFWSVKPLSRRECAVFIVDFSGHGVNAALNVFRLHTLIHGAHDSAGDPGAYMSHLNTVLKPLLPVGQFATMLYAVVDVESHTLRYASAAAPAPILYRSGGGGELLEASGMLLGAWEGASYPTQQTVFKPGDCLLLYSDALVETPDAQGKLLDARQAADLFAAGAAGAGGGAAFGAGFDALLDSFMQRYAPSLSDDLTMVAIGRP